MMRPPRIRFFSKTASVQRKPSSDPAVKTTSAALNKHGDAILQLAHSDLHYAREAQRYAIHYRCAKRSAEAADMAMQARALKARGDHRMTEAGKLHRRAKSARTLLERYGPIAWKVFIVLSIISMLAGIIGAWTSFKQLERIQHDAAIAAKKRQQTT